MDVYVRLTPEGLVARSELLADDPSGSVVLDYAEDGRLVGIEVIGAGSVEVDGVEVAT